MTEEFRKVSRIAAITSFPNRPIASVFLLTATSVLLSLDRGVPWRRPFWIVLGGIAIVMIGVGIFRRSAETRLKSALDELVKEGTDIDLVRSLPYDSWPFDSRVVWRTEMIRRLKLDQSSLVNGSDKDILLAISSIKGRSLTDRSMGEFAEVLLLAVREWLRKSSNHPGYFKVRREYERQLKRLLEAGHGGALGLTQVREHGNRSQYRGKQTGLDP